MEYDLSAVPAPPDDHRRSIRTIALACLAVPVGALLWSFATIPIALLTSPRELVVLVALVFFSGMILVLAAGFAPGAILCTTDEQGFTLGYRGGAERRFDWADPRLHVAMVEVVVAESAFYELATRLPFRNLVSAELYTALLDGARNRGLDVEVQQSEERGMRATAVEIRARRGTRRSRTP